MVADVALVPLLRAAKAVTGAADPADEIARKEVGNEFSSLVHRVLPEVRDFSQLRNPVPPSTFTFRSRFSWVMDTVMTLSHTADPAFRLRIVDRRPAPNVPADVWNSSQRIGEKLGEVAKAITAEADLTTGEVTVISENLLVRGESRLATDEAPIFDRVARHVATHLVQRGFPWVVEVLAGHRGPHRPVVAAAVEGHANLVGNGSAGIPFQAMAELAASRLRPALSLAHNPAEPLVDPDQRGLHFVAAIAVSRGIEGVNVIWERPDCFPRSHVDPKRDELLNPQLWDRRVFGGNGIGARLRRKTGRGALG